MNAAVHLAVTVARAFTDGARCTAMSQTGVSQAEAAALRNTAQRILKSARDSARDAGQHELWLPVDAVASRTDCSPKEVKLMATEVCHKINNTQKEQA